VTVALLLHQGALLRVVQRVITGELKPKGPAQRTLVGRGLSIGQGKGFHLRDDVPQPYDQILAFGSSQDLVVPIEEVRGLKKFTIVEKAALLDPGLSLGQRVPKLLLRYAGVRLPLVEDERA
tara:strand:+ start:245 stop:610 length:366 start_codon:yes stop_codon:yes gene_type:complete